MTTKHLGALEIDHSRGVIYFHDHSNGATLLRICRLRTPIPLNVNFIDITQPDHVAYEFEYDPITPTKSSI